MKRSVTSYLIRASNYQYFSSFLLLPIFSLSDVDVDKSIIEFHQHSHILVEVSHKEFNREKINLPRMPHQSVWTTVERTCMKTVATASAIEFEQ